MSAGLVPSEASPLAYAWLLFPVSVRGFPSVCVFVLISSSYEDTSPFLPHKANKGENSRKGEVWGQWKSLSLSETVLLWAVDRRGYAGTFA